MARLRHFAVCVKDLEKAAKFYESVFELKRIGREDLDIGSAIYMSDGVINLALLNFTGAAGSKASDLKDPSTHVGAHHFGFQVDDLAETQSRIEANGGKFFFDLGEERHGNFERKFKDPDGESGRHCEERSDEAIQSGLSQQTGLLRFARNDERLARTYCTN
jgi:predicted enzyme related to lactoylglutathione lyase